MNPPLPLWFLLAAALVLGSVPFLFGPSEYHFTSDDYWFVGHGELDVETGACSVARSFTGDWLTGARGSGGWLRPIPRITHVVNDWVFGLDRPWGYHLTNRLLHGLNGFLVFLLLLRWFGAGGFGAAAFGALVFLWYPPANGAVGWISGRTDLLAALFLLLAIQGAVSGWHAVARYAAVFGATVLACLSKESGFFAPLFLSAILLAFPRREGFLRWWGSAVACTAGAVLVFAWRWHFLGGMGGYADQIAQRPLADSVAWLVYYAGQSLWIVNAHAAVAWVAAGLGLGALALLVRRGRGWRAVGGGALVWMAAAVPVVYLEVHLVENGRFLYLSGLGLAMLLGGAGELAFRTRALPVAAGIAGGFLAISLLDYTRYDHAWRDASRAAFAVTDGLVAAAERAPGREHLAVHEDMDFGVYTTGPLQRNAPGAKILPWDQAKWSVYKHSRGRHQLLWGMGGGVPEEPFLFSEVAMEPELRVRSFLAAAPLRREGTGDEADFGALVREWEAANPPAVGYYAMLSAELTEPGRWYLPAFRAEDGTLVRSIEATVPGQRTRHTFNLGRDGLAGSSWRFQPLDGGDAPELHGMELILVPLVESLPEE